MIENTETAEEQRNRIRWEEQTERDAVAADKKDPKDRTSRDWLLIGWLRGGKPK